MREEELALSHQNFNHLIIFILVTLRKGRDSTFESLLSAGVRIVNLVLLDGRIHVTHKSGFVWTMDKKF